ncbi:PSD1 and planctomycete cytochrome C domain-containing protein [Lunatimonas lonarensis]|uniref:PSD1 and planctomycete cytochrome C domain-containing protein n=1 Tax=Lunatimonas lonarensis TaxID=1232681 RepID=UPI0009DC3286|nr:PSD1 and planctomycete cytochrome C domain-containing protein [Lunatimonas lonarensis]
MPFSPCFRPLGRSLFVYLFTAVFGFINFACDNPQRDVSLSGDGVLSYNFHVRPILSDKCFACHGPDSKKREAGLRLDTPEGAYAALKDRPSAHAIVPGKPASSEAIARIFSSDPGELMPPPESNLSLTESEKDLLLRWVKQGAAYEPHWAFVVPQKADVPVDRKDQWSRNEIDRFLWRSMKHQGLKPNEQAEIPFLLKRVALDLTGLPLSSDALIKYTGMSVDQAMDQLVDSLLMTPAFAERMAGFWLDVSRYSDSFGYQNDNYRTQWPYRDWVIHAFRKNMPYDEFITWQLAGDLLPNPTKEHILATGFNRNHKYTEEEGVIDEEYRVEYVVDKTNTFSKAILGLTMECAQCHDHKYDPVSQEDYFSLYAFFNNTPEKGFEGGAGSAVRSKTPLMTIEPKDLEGILSFINHKDTTSVVVSVMEEFRDTLRTTYVLARGAYDAPTDQVVTPRTPTSVLAFDENRFKTNRLGLAEWTFSEENPLTARVFVNLIWQELFGKGIVASSGDFGLQGDLPSHPELLDWLAVDFRENGWDIRYLLKKIMQSAAYRQSGKVSKELLEKDPDNVYLARFPRLRLPAEHIRDFVLESSGLLVHELGGPSVKPYQPEGLWEASSSGRGELAVYRMDSGDKLYRRGMYTFIKLTLPPPALLIFDGSNRDLCQIKRNRTNTPLQALALMNDPMVLEAARVLGARLAKAHSSPENAIQEAYRRILGREPKQQERQLMLDFFHDEYDRFQEDPQRAERIVRVGKFPLEPSNDPLADAAMMQVIVAIYNLEEATTKT